MIVLLQRVREARVIIDGTLRSEIGQGLLALVCAEANDTSEKTTKLAAKTVKLRVFADDAARMNKSVRDIGGSVLAVSQITLAADPWSGNRPSFSGAAAPAEGLAAYNAYVEAVRAEGVPCLTGEFGADMQVELINDGPATFILKL